MKSWRQVDYPAIAKAQRLSAERLGVVPRTSCNSAGNAKKAQQGEGQRSANNQDHAAQLSAAVTMQEEEGQHGGTPSPSLLWVWDTGTTTTVRTAARDQRGGDSKAEKIGQQAGISPTDENQRGRKKTRRLTRSRFCRRDAGQRRLDGSVSRSPSFSPPPPPPGRLGEDRGRREEERRTKMRPSSSLERTLMDIVEASLGLVLLTVQYSIIEIRKFEVQQ